MFPKDEVRKQIVQYFKAVGSGENIIQAIKEALFLNQQFNPLVLFEMLSQGKQRITRNDWKRYLINKSIAFSKDEIRYFFRHNRFGEEITLNQFLEALIPYNADVIREFKAKYLDSLEIQDLDPEVDFIFAELMINWFDFIRNLINIRSSLGRNARRSQIEHLVKEDLVLKSKPREAKKFLEAFQQSTFELSFHELRKFLQMQITDEEIIHQFYLLNVKRHIKCENPFAKIVPRSRKQKLAYRSRSRSRSLSGSRSVSASRSVSRRKQNEDARKRPISSKQRSNQEPRSPNIEQEPSSNKRRYNGSKYNDFKKQLQDSIIDEMVKSGLKKAGDSKGLNRNNNHDARGNYSAREAPEVHLTNQVVQRSLMKQNPKPEKKRPSLKPNQSQILVKMFQEIVLKQERLEKLRKQLAKTSDFSISNLFKLIDTSNKGSVSSQALQKFTQEAENYSNMVNFYAREKDRLRVQELGLIFRPLSKELNEGLDSRPESRNPNAFKKDTTRLILEIIRLQNEMHVNLNYLRNQIRKEGVSPNALFEFIDSKGKGFITSDNIREILEQNNINCEPKDLKCLMKLFDKKIDERILPKQFLGFIDF